jgi:hypothetical protein
MGETRVDLLHLLEDLRDAYPASTEETILTEIVANALDSGAATVSLTTDAVAPALTIADEGRGMKRRELARYHDIASSTKTRGARIGFAGVGIKIALLVCTEVVTETRRGASITSRRRGDSRRGRKLRGDGFHHPASSPSAAPPCVSRRRARSRRCSIRDSSRSIDGTKALLT